MTETGKGSYRAGLAFGYLAICAAVAILVSWYLDVWWYFFPIMMIAGGAYLLTIAIMASSVSTSKGGSYFVYLLLWGGLLLFLGVVWIVNDLYPGNAIFLVILFLVFIGAVSLIGYLIRRGR
jgi:hypothetical protein